MPRTTLAKTAGLAPYNAAGTIVTLTAADAGNFNQFILTGRELIIARNTGVGVRTVTITSVADPFGRLGTIGPENLAAGEVRVYGPFPPAGWQQVDGMLYLAASHAEVLFGVIVLP